MTIGDATKANAMVVNCKRFDVQFSSNFEPDSVKIQKANLAATLATLNTLDMTVETAVRKNAIKHVLERACVLDSAASSGYGANLERLDAIVKRVNVANDALQADGGVEQYIDDELKHYTQYKAANNWLPMVKNLVDEPEQYATNISSGYYTAISNKLNMSITITASTTSADKFFTVLQTDINKLAIGMKIRQNTKIGVITGIDPVTKNVTTDVDNWTSGPANLFYSKKGSVSDNNITLNNVTGLMKGMFVHNSSLTRCAMILSINGITSITVTGNSLMSADTDLLFSDVCIVKTNAVGTMGNAAVEGKMADTTASPPTAEVTAQPATSGSITVQNANTLLTVGMKVSGTGAGSNLTIFSVVGDTVTFSAGASTAEAGTYIFSGRTYDMNSILQSYFYVNGGRKSTEEILSVIHHIGSVKIVDNTSPAPSSTSLYLSDYNYIKALQNAVRSFYQSSGNSSYQYNHNSDYTALNQLIQSKMSVADVDAKIQELTELQANEKLNDNNDQILIDAVQSAIKEYNKFNFAGLNASLATRLQECGAAVSTKCDSFSNYQDYQNMNLSDTLPATNKNVDVLVGSINANHREYLYKLYNNFDLQMAICKLFDDTTMKVISDPMSQLKKM